MVNKLKNAAWLLLGAVALFWAATTLVGFVQGGPLDPPGPVGPTMKTLDEVEPRTPISQADMPFTISTRGSYYLTENLTGASGQNGITISISDVTLDLNGFTLIGVPGSLDGVLVSGVLERIAIYNGTVRNWGGDGVSALNDRRIVVKDLRAADNGGDGLAIGTGSTLTDCIASDNTGSGVVTDRWAAVSNCIAVGNGLNGITVASNSVVTDCVVTFNGGHGISAGQHSIVRNCSAMNNTGDGIDVDPFSYVIDNSSENNGFGVGDGAGIHAVGRGSRIEGNNVLNSDRGIDVDAFGNLIIKNSASFNTTDYDIVAGNTVGPILGPADPIASTNPWANFSY